MYICVYIPLSTHIYVCVTCTYVSMYIIQPKQVEYFTFCGVFYLLRVIIPLFTFVLRTHKCIHMYMYIYIHVCLYIHKYIFIYICTYRYIHIYIYVYIYINTYKYICK